MKPTSRRLVPFPAYSYAFIQRGVNYTRAFTAWVLFQKAGFELLRRPQAVLIICRRMRVSPKQARLILRRGEGKFWILADGMLYPQTPAQVTALIRNFHLTRYIKRSKFYVPEVALRNLGQLRAHLALPVISATLDKPTARAYTAKCLGRHRNTISTYRRWLLEAGFITVKSNYLRFPLARMSRQRNKNGWFVTQDGLWNVFRGPDIVTLALANLFRVDKSLRSYTVNKQVEFGGLKYRFSSSPTPTTAPPTPRPPPSTQAFVQMLRQEVRVKSPRWNTPTFRHQPGDFVPTSLMTQKEKRLSGIRD